MSLKKNCKKNSGEYIGWIFWDYKKQQGSIHVLIERKIGESFENGNSNSISANDKL
jgi:hypothetical protein